MSGIAMATTMTAILNRLLAADVVERGFDYPSDQVTPGSVVVGYPEIDYDATFRGGSDRAVYPVWFIVGRASERSARNAADAVISGSGSIKAALEPDAGGTTGTLRVMRCVMDEFTAGAVTYLAPRFDVEIYS
jgi:hypothetical protein